MALDCLLSSSFRLDRLLWYRECLRVLWVLKFWTILVGWIRLKVVLVRFVAYGQILRVLWRLAINWLLQVRIVSLIWRGKVAAVSEVIVRLGLLWSIVHLITVFYINLYEMRQYSCQISSVA